MSEIVGWLIALGVLVTAFLVLRPPKVPRRTTPCSRPASTLPATATSRYDSRHFLFKVFGLNPQKVDLNLTLSCHAYVAGEHPRWTADLAFNGHDDFGSAGKQYFSRPSPKTPAECDAAIEALRFARNQMAYPSRIESFRDSELRWRRDYVITDGPPLAPGTWQEFRYTTTPSGAQLDRGILGGIMTRHTPSMGRKSW